MLTGPGAGRTILPSGYQNSNYLGVSGMPVLPFSNSYPVSTSQSALPLSTSWPSSRAQIQGITQKKHPGSSLGEITIVYQVVLRIWENENYHNNVREGDALFVINGLTRNLKESYAIINVRDVNHWHEREYAKATRILEESAPDEKGRRTPILQQKGLFTTSDERRINVFKHLPTSFWETHPDISQALKTERTREAAQNLRYLTERGASKFFKFYGFARGQISDLAVRATAVARGNVVDSISNYWGNHVIAGMSLYWLCTRKRDPETGKYSHFGFWPYAGFDAPGPEHTLYTDYTGHINYCTVIYVGDVVRWVENFNYDPDYLGQLSGSQPLTRTYLNTTSAPGTLRIRMHALKGGRSYYQI